MDIRAQLLKTHSRGNSDLVEAFAIENEEGLVSLMACFLSDEKVVAQRAAMVVGNLGRSEPRLLKPWWSELVKVIDKPIHGALRRNATRYFSELKIALPKSLDSRLVNHCTLLVEDPNQDVAIAAFAMQIVADRAGSYPTHALRLRNALESQLGEAKPGFRNRARKVLKQLEPILAELG